MDVLIIDGHPGRGRLTSHLLDIYAAALSSSAQQTRINLRDLRFDPILADGYTPRQIWEPDLQRTAEALLRCDHLVVAFPMWWGAEPATLNGLLSRLLLPGFAFSYRHKGLLWDRLLLGRSADVIITMDTPPLYLRFGYGNPVVRRWNRQVLGFVGFKPVRFHLFGPVRQGGAERSLPKWEERLRTAALSAPHLRRQPKSMPALPS
jgi:putative NADPH-quinone reductase